MNYLEINKGTAGYPVKLHYSDYGKGKPVILIHGWPMSAEMWEYQINDLVEAGYRVITYDRRGFGKSYHPWDGYDYDTMTDDLKALIDHLNLRDITLVGFSMGGGEVIRYFSRYGGKDVIKAVLISSITPYLLKTGDNPHGVPQDMFDDMAQKMTSIQISKPLQKNSKQPQRAGSPHLKTTLLMSTVMRKPFSNRPSMMPVKT